MDLQTFKQALLDKLFAPYKHCTLCPLGSLGRTQVVFGEGNPNSPLMIIGEGPGRDEDAQGRPFVGRSGRLLTRTLEHLGITREDVYITNIVKCRPPNNRAPKPNESETCKNAFLKKQIQIIRPKIICTLGSSALRGLAEKELKITKVRGQEILLNKMNIFPTYHPAYILRNQKELPIFVNDIKRAIEKSTLKVTK